MNTMTLDRPAREASGDFGPSYRIGDLAREFGVTLRTLRFYEDKGLIKPFRRGTTRIYSPADREKLMLALFCKRIGLPLKAIRTVLEIGDENDPRIRAIYEEQTRELAREEKRVAAAAAELQERRERLDAAN